MGVFDPAPQAEPSTVTDDKLEPGDEKNTTLPGATLISVTTNALSTQEREALDAQSRPQGGPRSHEIEIEPLPAHLHAQTGGPQLEPSATFPLDGGDEALCLSCAPGGKLLAVGFRDGQVHILDVKSGEVRTRLGSTHDDAACPAVCFRPDPGTAITHNVLLAARGDTVTHFHASSGQVLQAVTEPLNQVYALDFRPDATAYASAGSDCKVRVYDESAHSHGMVTLDAADSSNSGGHSNHVYALRWHPEDPQVLLSGGWDNTVQIWDLRTGTAARSCHGPYLCGGALDISGGKILTGSWRNDHPLQLWDYGSGRLLTHLPWPQPRPDACFIYAAQFLPGGQVAAGGSGHTPVVRIISQEGVLHSEFAPGPGCDVHAFDVPSDPGGQEDAAVLHVCCRHSVHAIPIRA